MTFSAEYHCRPPTEFAAQAYGYKVIFEMTPDSDFYSVRCYMRVPNGWRSIRRAYFRTLLQYCSDAFEIIPKSAMQLLALLHYLEVDQQMFPEEEAELRQFEFIGAEITTTEQIFENAGYVRYDEPVSVYDDSSAKIERDRIAFAE